MKPVIIAVVLQALWSLGRTAARTRGLAATGLLSLAAAAAGVDELAVVFGAVLAALTRLRGGGPGAKGILAMPAGAALGSAATGVAPSAR